MAGGKELLRELSEAGVVAVAKIPGYCWKCKTSDQTGEGHISPWKMEFFYANLCTNCANDWGIYFQGTPEFAEGYMLNATHKMAIREGDELKVLAISGKMADYQKRVFKMAKAWVEQPVTFDKIKTHASIQVQRICSAMFDCLADLTFELFKAGKPKPCYYDGVVKAMRELGMAVPVDSWAISGVAETDAK